MTGCCPAPVAKTREHAAQVDDVAAMLRIETLLDRKPSALSGGQKQRAAAARALVRDPIAFLLDEPLSNLDAALRVEMRGELTDLHRRTGRTFIYVTHDQAEAMSLSDRVAVIMHGRILQSASPEEIYEAPLNREVAGFLGDHPINLIDVIVGEAGLPAPLDAFAVQGAAPGSAVTVGLRPENLRLTAHGPLTGRVTSLEYLGSKAIASVALAGGHEIRAILPTQDGRVTVGETISLAIDPDRAHVFAAETGIRLDARLLLRSTRTASGTAAAGGARGR